MGDYEFIYSQRHVYHLLVAAHDLPLVLWKEYQTYHLIQQLRGIMRHWWLQQESMAVQKKKPTPAFDGMFNTLNKCCKLNTIKDYVLSNDKLKDKVVSNVYKGNVRSFENSPTNVKRSIATFYSSGIMGKRKYQAV